MLKPDSFKILAAILLFLISVTIFSLLAHEVVIENEDWFDSTTFTFLKSWSSPFVIRIFELLTFFGSTYFLFSAYIIVIITLLYKRQKKEALDMGILGVTSTILLHGLKAIFSRHRPEFPLLRELKDYSFPSGHAFSSFIFFGALAWLIWKTSIHKKWKWLLALFFISLATVIGISRIVLRYHYASDVVAGLSLGIACILLFLWWREASKKKT